MLNSLPASIHFKAEVIIAKQRHGPVGSINVHFEKSFTHFSDLTDDSRVPDHF